ncbi:hypothetical protein H6P81_005503 [Aristolochia fimbriata]|uniref:AB hydrolase-1 domain-containing protein n=1 Tax=Aristolochia fimbriata TaxID=158543 RepID=A0AAV7EVT6_ARIFI|nr:hypothetical protein H6P81_005503 [Aristolochia fimbriata]
MSSDGASGISSSLEIIGSGESLLATFASLRRPYKPFPVLAWNAHVETIAAFLFRSVPDVTFRRECLRTKDDGTVALDWVSGDDTRLPPDSPTLILLPGHTGGSSDAYVRHMLLRASKKGWRVVVFNHRGCENSPVTTPQLYSASFTEDISHVVKHIRSRFPKSNIYAIGWSLGGNILVRYVGEKSEKCPLSGAVSLCNPFNLVIADENLRKGFNKVYDRSLRSALCKIYKKHAVLFEGMGDEYKTKVAANPKTLKEFDEALTRVSFGFESVDDYYSKSCSSDSIKDVRIPLFCIQAANDPIAPQQAIPREDIKENPNCLLIVTPKGGHLGWIAGDEAPFGAPWTDPVVMEFLEHIQKLCSA